MDWSKLDPNTVLGAFTLLTTFGVWVYRKARGQKTESFAETIGSTFDNFAAELLDTYVPTEDVTKFLQRSRAFIEERAWKILTKRGIPKNSTTERLVHSGIEKATAYLGQRAAEIRIPYQLNNIAETSERIGGEFNTLPTPTR